MPRPAGQFGNDESRGGPPAEAGPADAPTYPHCSRCQVDLTHCFLSARFCPRCGAMLAALPREPLPPVPVPPPLPVRALSLGPREAGDTHSLILGYANAMFRLGWRYESGEGTCRNTREAVRCYFKAAKLGNASALARLTPQDEHDPAQPDGADAASAG